MFILSAIEQFDYLKALGEETALIIVRELTEGDNLAVYEGEPNAKNDAELLASYNKAVDACRIWLKAVLAAEVVSETKKDISAEASLILPDRRLEVSVYSSEYPFGGGNNSDEVEKLHTPIGVMDFHTYKTIIDTPINPVKELYCFFEDLIHQIHNIIVMPTHRDGEDDVLSEYTVEDENIVDVLGVSKFDSLWYSVREALTDKFAVKGVDVNGKTS